MFGKAKSGYFYPKHPEKYKGDPKNIIWRSKLERSFFRYFDTTDSIIQWSSEEFCIPYQHGMKEYIDKKTKAIKKKKRIRRYFPDCWTKVRSIDGEIKEFLIEIKPFAFTFPPTKPKSGRITKSYKILINQYIINKLKWETAEKYSVKKGMKFIILTEKDLK